jgi:hypothetical protein
VLDGVGGQHHALAALPREKDPVNQEDGQAPGLVMSGVKYLAPAAIRSPDRPARSDSLYRLRYPGHTEDRIL